MSPCGGTHARALAGGPGARHRRRALQGQDARHLPGGGRPRRDLGAHATTLRALGRDLSCDALLVPQGVAKLRDEIGGSRDALGKMRGRLAEAIAATLARRAGSDADGGAGGSTSGAGGSSSSGVGGSTSGGGDASVPVVAVFEDASMDLLRSIGARLTAEAGVVVVLGGRATDGMNVLVAARSGRPIRPQALSRSPAAVRPTSTVVHS